MGAAGDVLATHGSVLLLELSAADDLPGFRRALGEDGLGVDLEAPWYGRWGRRMGFEPRTPLMVAAMYGSVAVLEYILGTGAADVNRACGSDGATALHCAASGGSPSAGDAVKMLVDASADVGAVDVLGNTPGDVIPRQLSTGGYARTKLLSTLPKADGGPTPKGEDSPSKREEKKGEKKEYPPDLTLPDIKNGIYSTDEFRMYTFKVKPCSRAYSHDWTECPFVHPGENARRRDPRKYHYSCVPCPEFRKGSCRNGDGCEYAHGVFECWLHPAQYRTRLCKDETGCARRVCFFAHKPEELRPLYPSGAPASPAGGVLPSPRSPALPPLDMATAAALLLNQPATPSASSSAGVWLNQASGVTTPTLQLSTSRLKTSLSARNLGMDMDLMALEGYQQQLLDDYIANLASPSSRKSNFAGASAAALSSSDYADMLGSLESSSLLSQLQGLSLRQSSAGAGTGAAPFQSPSGIQMLSGYGGSNLPSSPSVRGSLPSLSSSSSSSFGLDHSLATAVRNSKASAFAKRSQSFCDRGAVSRPPGFGMTGLAAAPASAAGPALSDWSSPGGKLDWGIQGEELNKLRKSASFGFRSNGGSAAAAAMAPSVEEPDVSWVQSLVKDGSPLMGRLGAEPPQQQQQYQVNNTGEMLLSPWMEQLYAEQEQMVA